MRDVNSKFYQRKDTISEKVFNIALLVDVFLMKLHFHGENTVNIVSIGCWDFFFFLKKVVLV